MEEVEVAESRLADYREIIGEAAAGEVLDLADRARGMRVAHINATAYGGGVAEMLHSLLPLMRDVGLDAHWFVLEGIEEFHIVTKALHNALQGADIEFTPGMLETYGRANALNAETFVDDFDCVVVHDPQPAPLVSLCERRGVWLWRCHVDLTVTNPRALEILAPYLAAYDRCLFSDEAYVPRHAPLRGSHVIHPAIDPRSEKNRDLPPDEYEEVLARLPFDPGRPLLSQVGRYDPWKDPLGVIDAYRLVKAEVPDVQLALVGSMAKDDPEGWAWYERTADHAGDDPDIHLLTDLEAVEVNVLQRATTVGLVKSLREGFGLTVTESLWKGVPVVGGKVGGIAFQVEDGTHGFLVSSVQEAADRSLELLNDEARRRAMGAAGRERVREHFLITRLLRDHLRLYLEVTGRA